MTQLQFIIIIIIIIIERLIFCQHINWRPIPETRISRIKQTCNNQTLCGTVKSGKVIMWPHRPTNKHTHIHTRTPNWRTSNDYTDIGFCDCFHNLRTMLKFQSLLLLTRTESELVLSVASWGQQQCRDTKPQTACFIQEAEAATYFEAQGKEGDKEHTKRRQKKKRNVIDGVNRWTTFFTCYT